MNDFAAVDRAVRQREAGDFLRSRRERLTPAEVGLSHGFRRRTPGLRREEVAMLADVGTTWYTWLEQGRDVKPSGEVLSALAEALRLDATERRHLFALYNRQTRELPTSEPERINEPLRRMLDSLSGQPALVLGRRWDILAWNRAAEVVYGSYEPLVGDERNVLHLMFTNLDHRRLFVDWSTVARAALAMFRADCASYAGDPSFEHLIASLTHLSPEFAEWWPQREVARPVAGAKRINHPIVGQMLFHYSSLGVSDAPDMKLIVFTPLDDDSASKLAKLVCV